ncbi:hypothetical protein FQR65_LT13386 [Abscondita terminalis]|nr:hypothetical protein FQR65_LT13386 [Abscondita terminalis]
MEMLKEIKAIKINQEKTNEEMKEIRLEIKQMNEKWENKCKKLEERVDSLERKTEILEKEKRRKNLVIKGLEVCGDKEEEKMLSEKKLAPKSSSSESDYSLNESEDEGKTEIAVIDVMVVYRDKFFPGMVVAMENEKVTPEHMASSGNKC